MEIKSNYATNPSAAANGKIDSDFKQNLPGDCALLASIFSLAQTQEGAQKIEDSINIIKDKNGNIVKYNVTFDGPNETYTVTQKELEAAKEKGERQYATGDDDVTILELAIEKCFKQSDDDKLKTTLNNYPTNNPDDVLNAVNPSSVTYLLADETLETAYVHSPEEKSLTKTFIPQQNFTMNDIDGNPIEFKEEQLYKPQQKFTLNGTKVITVEDSNSNKTYTLNYEEFMQNTFAENSKLSTQKAEDLFENYEQNPNDNILIFGVPQNTTLTDINGQDVTLTTKEAHTYIVSEVDGDNITLLNSARPLGGTTVSKEELLNLDNFWVYGTQKEDKKAPETSDAVNIEQEIENQAAKLYPSFLALLKAKIFGE